MHSYAKFQKNPIFFLLYPQAKGAQCEEAVRIAITLGCRSIDTAYTYQNEVEVGKAICGHLKEGNIKREELFIVTKVIFD